SLLVQACKDENNIDGDEFTKIECETLSAEIPTEGGVKLIASKDTLWSIYGCHEIRNGEKVFIPNECNVINQINYLKDTIYGDWYSIFKKEQILTVVIFPNTEETERYLWIECGGIMRSQAIITITQK
ncbi:MAG: hypothetical protein LIP00_09245, partial [Parabacteroides sp.]|nr:hypothetical protein [Parabacteroides sp.]